MHLQVSHLQGPHEHDLVSQAQLVQGLEQLQLVEQAMVVVGGMVVGVVVRESVMELVLRFELVLCGVWRVGVWRTSLCVSPPPLYIHLREYRCTELPRLRLTQTVSPALSPSCTIHIPPN